MVNDCLGVTRCIGITVWGIDDESSWVPYTFPGEGAPLLYDGQYNRKPAWYAVYEALGGDSSGGGPGEPGGPGGPGGRAVLAVRVNRAAPVTAPAR